MDKVPRHSAPPLNRDVEGPLFAASLAGLGPEAACLALWKRAVAEHLDRGKYPDLAAISDKIDFG
jgi:hypothetical protein